MDLRVGIDVRGSPGLEVRRPYGSGDYVCVFLLRSAYVGRDRSHVVKGGDCLVWRPDSPSFLSSDSTIYNHFVHLSADLAEPAFWQCPVRFDSAFTLRSPGFVRPLLMRMQREWVHRDRHWERAIELSVLDLALHLSRETNPASLHPASQHDERLRAIRLQIHEQPAQAWTLAQMAELAHLRESQFSALYRQLFGRSPIDDLVQTRLELARYYLAQIELPVSAVGELVGFADPAYFSRIFRRHVGCAPRQYRRDVRQGKGG